MILMFAKHLFSILINWITLLDAHWSGRPCGQTFTPGRSGRKKSVEDTGWAFRKVEARCRARPYLALPNQWKFMINPRGVSWTWRTESIYIYFYWFQISSINTMIYYYAVSVFFYIGDLSLWMIKRKATCAHKSDRWDGTACYNNYDCDCDCNSDCSCS